MLSELRTAHKVIGVKQSKKAIRDGAAAEVYVALDAEKRGGHRCRCCGRHSPAMMLFDGIRAARVFHKYF